jgi:hypothetical protein
MIELTFFTRSWLNVIVIWQAMIRRRSADWMLDALSVMASMIAVFLIVIGFIVYWLVSKWGGR